MVLRDLEDVLSARWPFATLKPFGSFPACLSIFLSDLDVTVYGLGVEGEESASSGAPQADAHAKSRNLGNKSRETVLETAEEEWDDDGGDCDEISWCLDTSGAAEAEGVMSEWSVSCEEMKSNDGDGMGPDIHISGRSDEVPSLSSPVRALVRPRRFSIPSISDKALKRKTLGLLHTLAAFMRSLDWAEQMEVRSRAKVPIINVMHRGGVEIDISLGISGSSTSAVVEKISNIENGYKDLFFTVSSFLKCFLHQLRLDKPYSGGLGSFKLYVMIAYVIVKVVHPMLVRAEGTKTDRKEKVPPCPDSAFLLMAFFAHFGKATNLNQYTELEVLGATVDFTGAQLVTVCQQVFMRAHSILRKAMDEGPESILKLAGKGGKQLHSRSLLALLLVNTEAFVNARAAHSQECSKHCPLLTDADKDRMGRSVLTELQRKQHTILDSAVTAEDVKRVNPMLWERLRCFSSVSSAVTASATQPFVQHHNQLKRCIDHAHLRQAKSDARKARMMESNVPGSKRKRNQDDSGDFEYRDSGDYHTMKKNAKIRRTVAVKQIKVSKKTLKSKVATNRFGNEGNKTTDVRSKRMKKGVVGGRNRRSSL